MLLEKAKFNCSRIRKKIALIDLKFNLVSSNNIFDGKIAYISELKDGKVVVIDLDKFVKIVEINDNKLEIHKKIETREESNFVGIEISNKKIICGGDNFLSIIEPSIFDKYSLKGTIHLGSFISNIVEINKNCFLVGLCYSDKIIIYSSENNEKISEIENIYFRGNNYAITKLSDDLIGIAGSEQKNIGKGCIYIYSINKRIICKKFLINDIKLCEVIVKINNEEFITSGAGLYTEKSTDLALLNYKYSFEKLIINKINVYKNAFSDTTEAIISLNNFIIASDSSSYLKVWKIE